MDKTCKARNIIWQNTYSLGVGCTFALAFGIFGSSHHVVSIYCIGEVFSTYNLIDFPVLTEMIAVYLSRHFTVLQKSFD